MTVYVDTPEAMDDPEKLETYLFDDPAWGWVIGGEKDTLLEMLWVYIHELKDGEEIELVVKRKDMTQAQMDASPVV